MIRFREWERPVSVRISCMNLSSAEYLVRTVGVLNIVQGMRFVFPAG